MWLELRHSLRGKLIAVVLITTTIAVLVAGIAMLSRDLTVYRHSWVSDLVTQADILALSTGPALDFDDRDNATRDLTALQARPEVRVAAIYTAKGELYTRYVRPGAKEPPPTLTTPVFGFHISGEQVELIHPIKRRGEWLGTIYLNARYDVRGRIRAYLEILAIVTAVAVSVALLLSAPLQRVIMAPLDAMTDVARRVVDRADYSPRVSPTRDRDIGVVVEAFNRMLGEVQARTRALQSEVEIRQSTEAALAHANARLESTMAAAEIGSWVWDFNTQQVSADRNLAALYGVADEKQLPTHVELFRQRIHPADRATVSAAEKQALQTGILAPTDFRIIQSDGSVRWVAARGKVQFDANGQPMLLAGLLMDLTAQKRAEAALRASEKLYRAIGESIEYGVWVCDSEGRNTYMSDSFLRLTGMSREQCSALAWLDAEEAAATAAAWKDCVRNGANWYSEHRVRGTDGQYHAILTQGVAIRDEEGRITGWAGINLDISRLKHTEEALREADRRKDEFLATLAHELRNPLAPIRHAVKLLELPAANDRQRQWGRDVISRQVQRMALLLDDLLDVSRITRGRLQLKKSYISLNALIAAAVETARPLLEAKQHVLRMELPPEPIELEVDPLRLSQALSNLLTNAAKYTDVGGQITLRARLQPEVLIIAVEDTGIGLSATALPRLFEMFSQVESPVDRTEGGLGIGLALVKGLIGLHGGTVEAASAGVGRGSCFTLRLPSSCVARRNESAERPRSAATPIAGASCRILVADDNRDAADSLALVLKMSGYAVEVAHGGSQVLELANRTRPDIFLLDIGMPDMNGHELARRIRQEAWGRDALLVALTGWGQEEDRERSHGAGFDHHLTKPVDPDQLAHIIAAFAQQAQNHRSPGSAAPKVSLPAADAAGADP